MLLSPASWTGILLAAGRGRRFDPHGVEDKLQQILPDGHPVALTAAQHLSSVMKHVVVVVRPDNRALLQEFQHQLYEVVICPDADQGMAASLTCGLRHAARSKGWIIALADMPFVKSSTIAALLRELENGADIVVPVFQGQRGNPVGFSGKYLPELLALSGDRGARGLLQQFPVREVPVDDAGILQDIDLPTDLSAQ